MANNVKQSAVTVMTPELAKRNTIVALVHLAIVLGILAAFVWSVSSR